MLCIDAVYCGAIPFREQWLPYSRAVCVEGIGIHTDRPPGICVRRLYILVKWSTVRNVGSLPARRAAFYVRYSSARERNIFEGMIKTARCGDL